MCVSVSVCVCSCLYVYECVLVCRVCAFTRHRTLLLFELYSGVALNPLAAPPPVSRAFEDVQVFWRATHSAGAPSLVSGRVNLTQELLVTSGAVLCLRGQTRCVLTLEVRPDEVSPLT